MKTETMLALQSYLKKDYSKKNQYRQADMLRMILEINQDVICHGLCKIEDYEAKTMLFPMLGNGLRLVRRGIEPHMMEAVLLNMAFANEIYLLKSLLVIDGSCSIQMQRPVELTKELLLSYFTFDVQEDFRNSLQHLKINSCEPLTKEEVERLLKQCN